MSTNLDTARARLRAADPADPVDPHDSSARAMFERIVTDPSEPVHVRTRSPRRRLALAGAAVAAVAATVTAGVVTTPWSHGHPSNAAFAVDRKPDGSIGVAIEWDQLVDPAALNAELARLHARTVVFRQSQTCHAPLAVDRAEQYRTDGHRHIVTPWVKFPEDGGRGLITIYPQKIPAGDTIVFAYQLAVSSGTRAPDGQPYVAGSYGAVVVRSVPPCVGTHPTW